MPQGKHSQLQSALVTTLNWAIGILSPEQSHTRVTKNLLHRG